MVHLSTCMLVAEATLLDVQEFIKKHFTCWYKGSVNSKCCALSMRAWRRRWEEGC